MAEFIREKQASIGKAASRQNTGKVGVLNRLFGQLYRCLLQNYTGIVISGEVTMEGSQHSGV